MKNILPILCITMALVLASCKKVIERESVEIISTTNFYKTAVDAETGLIGCYNKFLSWDFYGKLLFYSDISSDDIQAYNDNGDLFRLENRTQLIPNNGEITSIWNGGYNAIANINLMLEKVALIDNNKFLADRKKQILAEGRMLRAYIYYYFTKLYGDVPLVLSFPTSASATANQVPRNTIAEVTTQVKADLLIAEQDLPVNYNIPNRPPDVNLQNSKGRVTKATAKALQMRMLLAENNWNGAAAKAQEIIALNEHTITNVGFVSVFRSNDGGQNTKESIWEAQSVEQPGGFDNTGVLKFFYTGSPIYGATQSVYNSYDPGGNVDVRKEQSMFQVNNPTRVYAQKYKNYYSNEPNDNYVIFRLAEVLLSRAEALNEVGYPNTEALTIINSIRARAADPNFRFGACTGIPPITFATVPTQASFRAFIQAEKRREMTQEGLRWFDLLRWDRVLATSVCGAGTNQQKLLFPIPQNDRDRNPNLTQNPGY